MACLRRSSSKQRLRSTCFFFSSRRRHTRLTCDWSSDVCSSDLDDVREPLAEVTPVEREVRTGDVAVIDVEVEADGQVVESESRKAMEAELKEGVLLPELLAALPGTFVDEQREVTVKFPDDYSEPKLAAREGTIR